MFWQSERRKSISFFRILSKMYGIWFLSSLPHPCPLPPLYFKMYCIGFFFFSPTPLSSTSSLFYFRIFGMVLFLLFPPCPLPPLVLSRYTALGSFFSSTPLSSTSSLFQDVRHWFSTSLCLPHSLLLFKICGSLFHTVVLYLLSISICTCLTNDNIVPFTWLPPPSNIHRLYKLGFACSVRSV